MVQKQVRQGMVARMCRIIIAVVSLLNAVAVGAEWQMTEFMISLWDSAEDEASAQAIIDANFNTAMCDIGNLDLCRRYGLKAIVMGATPEMAADRVEDSAVWGYYVKDEPTADEFPAVGQQVAVLHRADPSHPAYVNVMAWMDLDQYLQIVAPKVLSYDYYQWWWGTQNHFSRLAAHRRAALGANIPLICWLEANADPRWEWGEPGCTYLPDNAVKLRQSVYTAIAYGVKGIQWFNELLMFSDHQLTQAGEDVAALNAELRRVGPNLIRLESVDVFHTLPLPTDTKELPTDHWVQTTTPDLVLGTFKAELHNDFMIVANRLIDHRRWAVLQFRRSVSEVTKFDKQEGRWVSLPLSRWGRQSTVEFILAPGDGELLKIR